MNKKNTINSNLSRIFILVLLISTIYPSSANFENYNVPDETERNYADPSNNKIEKSANQIVLLVGIGAKELGHRELSNLSGFEFFSVPYGTDTMALTSQINPAQIIIRHPSGFVGLYSKNGQLIRGVETSIKNDSGLPTPEIPESIIKPINANSPYQDLYYPGALTGTIPHGGLGFVPVSKRKTFLRGLLKVAAFGSLVPFQFPAFYRGLTPLDGQSGLFPALLAPVAPNVVTAAASYADARLDQDQYEAARTEPRDYMFQPVIEGY